MKLIKGFKQFLFEAKIQDIRSAITGEKPYSNFFLYPGVIEGILKNDPSVAFTIAGQKIDQKDGPLNKSMVEKMGNYIPLAHKVLDYIQKNYPVSQKDIEEYSGSGLGKLKILDLLYALSQPDLNILRFRIVGSKKYYWPFEKGDIEILGKWDKILKETPYTKDDHDRYLAVKAKRRREGNESITDQERFSEQKYFAAHRKNLVPQEFLSDQVDWDTYFVIFPYTQDDHDLYLAALAKRNRGEKESLTEPESFAINKYNAASRRNLITKEFKTKFDWDTYLKENPYTPDDKKRYNSAVYKRSSEGSESLTDEDRFAGNKYLAYLKRRKLKKQAK